MTTAIRDFAAELTAARAAGDWDAAARIWEERRVASVEADEASIALCHLTDAEISAQLQSAKGAEREALIAEAGYRCAAQLVITIHPAPTHDEVVAYLEGYYAKTYTTEALHIGFIRPSEEADLAETAHDVNVYLYFADGRDEVHSWTVWTEDVGHGPFTYGEW